jgi:hypothetical protein
MLAHKVAQYYQLRTETQALGPAQSRVVATRTSTSCLQEVRFLRLQLAGTVHWWQHTVLMGLACLNPMCPHPCSACCIKVLPVAAGCR